MAEKQAGLSSPSATGSSEDVEVGEALLASDIVGYLDGVNKTWAHIIRDDTSRSGPLSVTFRQDSLVGIQAQISGRKGRSSGEDASQGWVGPGPPLRGCWYGRRWCCWGGSWAANIIYSVVDL